jgi:HD-GYP domain-containing protein (c-di-GMP phosphodiesterase class II)
MTTNDKEHVDAFTQLASATDEFEQYKSVHAVRIAELADEIAQHFLLASRDRRSLRAAALLHDLGEAAMERDYIQRAGALSDEERIDLQRHPVIGEQESARAGADRATNLLVRWHHEWWNGGGYPDALRGEQIPLEARILRVADAYASLTDARPFRPAGTEAEARKHLTLWAGLEFDPQVVRAFLALQGLPELRSFAQAPAVAAETAAKSDEAVAEGEAASPSARPEAGALVGAGGLEAEKIGD